MLHCHTMFPSTVGRIKKNAIDFTVARSEECATVAPFSMLVLFQITFQFTMLCRPERSKFGHLLTQDEDKSSVWVALQNRPCVYLQKVSVVRPSCVHWIGGGGRGRLLFALCLAIVWSFINQQTNLPRRLLDKTTIVG